MRFGLMLPSYSFADLDYARAGRLRDFATRAEALGYESLWVPEHLLTARGLYGTAWLSPLETMAFVAGCTTRIKLATGILVLPIRNPVFMAKEIASLQYLSGGRFELGVGPGWDQHEFDVAGIKLSQRGGRTDEILDIFDRLWTGEPSRHRGKYYSFDDVTIDPPLRERPRLWVGGGGKVKTALSPDPAQIAPAVLERIVRRADGWIAPRRRIERERHRGLAHHHRAPEGNRAPARQPDLRPPQFRPCRADRRRGGGVARAAPADRARDGHAPVLRASANLLLPGQPAPHPRPHRRAGGCGMEYLVLSPLDYEFDQLDLWESEILHHFR